MKRSLRGLHTRRLFSGAVHGNEETVREALRFGADIRRVSSRRGRTALIMACGGGMPSLAVVQELIAAGVDVHVRDSTGHTALDWAKLRLAQMGPWTTEELPRRSDSLDEYGNVVLHDFPKIL
jgi:hypothetical protein